MKPYQVIIEGVFISPPGVEHAHYGFFSTFFVFAHGAKDAVCKANDILNNRLGRHGVRKVKYGLWKTKLCVHDLWELDPATYELRTEPGDGFSFFRISLIESIKCLIRMKYIDRFKPYMIIR